jgi:uncharacterized protein (DUF697 family)
VDTKQKAHAVIHSAAAAAAATAGAMAQGAIVGADAPILTGIHVGMVVSLGELLDQRIDKSTAIAFLGTAAGAGVGVAIAKGLLGLMPGIGNAANAAATAAHTEALGWLAYKYFGGPA